MTPKRRRFLCATRNAFAVAIGAATFHPFTPTLADPLPGLRIIEQRRTRFGVLAVVELGRKRYLAYGPDTRLIYQSVLDLDRPHELAAPYMRLMMLGLVYAAQPERIVQIGVGAGNMAGYAIRNFESVAVDAVDIDPNAIELGAKYFGLKPDPRLRIHIADGKAWLAAAKSAFDVVMLDAYDDRSIPAELADASFFTLVASRLDAGGAVVQNAYLPIVEGRRLLAAMRSAFANVDIYRINNSAVLVGYQGPGLERAQLTDRAQRIDARSRPLHPLAEVLRYRAHTL